MPRSLIISEKPSVARDIARVLKCTRKQDNVLQNDKYVITWALGHLVSLKEPDELNEAYKKWKIEDLPILPNKIPLKVLPKTSQQYKIVKKWFLDKDIDTIICATDAGREGELIFRLIYEQSGCTKPIKRLWISSMTDEAINQGFKSIKNGKEYDSLYYSAVCRSYADWYIGMNASRCFSIRYNAHLSVGRVQTPTLGLIVERQKLIDKFVPEEFYTLNANFGDFHGTWFNEKEENYKTNTHIASKEQAEKIKKNVSGKTAKVISNTSTDKSEVAPLLYDLTSLQRDANTKCGFTAKKTLQIAQELYEKHKVLTYPRTDSRCLTDDMRSKIPGLLNSLPSNYKQYIPQAMQTLNENDCKRVFNNDKVSDHHALIPTGKYINLSQLPPDCATLMELVIKRFIATFFPNYRTKVQKIVMDCEQNKFLSTGKAIVDLGWRAVENDTSNKKGKTEELIPALNINDTRTIKSIKLKKDATKPPATYTDASLLSAMEHADKVLDDDELRDAMRGSGLGTPATRAAIIERLLSVKYLKRKGKSLVPTEKGTQLIEIVPDKIASPILTGTWEKDLNTISTSKDDAKAISAKFLNGIKQLTSLIVEQAKNEKKDVVFETEKQRRSGKSNANSIGEICPICKKGSVNENSKAFGCSDWQDGCKFTLWKNCLERFGGPTLNKAIIKILLQKGNVTGSSGTVQIKDKKLQFIKTNQSSSTCEIPLEYQNNNK